MIRTPVAAGTFYPAHADRLARTVDGLLAHTEPRISFAPRAIVVPHAGYAYSGPIAASAYILVPNAVRRVALFGPSHFVPLTGAAVPRATAWVTPLGAVEIDGDLATVARSKGATDDDAPHEPEHALEVQLPFLQRRIAPGFTVLPVAVGGSTPAEAADLFEPLLERVDLVVVSTDLSHYLDDATAKRRDRVTADAVLGRDPEAIGSEAACGVFALRGLVEVARRRDLEVHLLDLRTSADTAGDPGRVVGYGAFAFA